MKHIRILTYNVQKGRRINNIVDWLNRLPDTEVICLQEFPEEKIQECLYLLGRVPYGYGFVKVFTQKNRVYGQLTLYRKDFFNRIKTRTIVFGINRIERTLLKTTVPRASLILTGYIDKQPITFVNVHIVALASNKAKYIQVAKLITSLKRITTPIVLVGDFNLSSILGKQKLIKIMKLAGFITPMKKISTHRVGMIKHQFDYLFAKGCEIHDYHSLKIRFSDHFPVLATCKL